MILLDVIDAQEKDPNSLLTRNKSRVESLPPYSRSGFAPKPFNSVASLSSASSRSTASSSNSSASFTAHPRSASLSTPSVSHASGSTSTSTLVPPSSPSPSASLFSHAIRKAPPRHLRASNNVYIEREVAGIMDPFLIDPLLEVPDCLLPDGIGASEGRCNLSLVTRTGDVCADVWIREGSAFRSRCSSTAWGKQRCLNEGGKDGEDDYWADGWTYRHPPAPHERASQKTAVIEAKTEKGSIALKIHTQFHQRLRIRASSIDGSIAIAIPRTFTGYIYINNNSDNTSAAIDCPITDTAARISPRQPVHFSPEIQEVVKTEKEQRRNAKGRYFLGMATDQIEPKEYLDSLSVDSRSGIISIFFDNNPSFGLLKPDNTIFSKLITKARS